jgi:hypothetical protein
MLIEHSAKRLYESFRFQKGRIVAFNVLDPLTLEVPKKISDNGIASVYEFKDGSQFKVKSRYTNSYQWLISWSDGDNYIAIMGVSYQGPGDYHYQVPSTNHVSHLDDKIASGLVTL